MILSSNGSIFRVIGPLLGESTGHKGQRRGASMFSLICARTNSWANNRDADDLRCHRTIMTSLKFLFYEYHIVYMREESAVHHYIMQTDSFWWGGANLGLQCRPRPISRLWELMLNLLNACSMSPFLHNPDRARPRHYSWIMNMSQAPDACYGLLVSPATRFYKMIW